MTIWNYNRWRQIPEGALCHFGIKGQHWGVRRFQNKDGSLTPEGKRRYNQELKSDRNTAFQLGKFASITERAADHATKKTLVAGKKVEKAYAKDPLAIDKNTRSKIDNLNQAMLTDIRLHAISIEQKAKLEKFHADMIEKYGKENIADIKYTKDGRLNEPISRGRDWLLLAFGVYPDTALGGKAMQGRRLYKVAYNASRLTNRR